MLSPPPPGGNIGPLPELRRPVSSQPTVANVAVVRGIPLDRPQNVAIGLIGDPVPRVGSGAAVSRNS